MENLMGTLSATKASGRAVSRHGRDYSWMFANHDQFLHLSYAELEEKNMEIKRERLARLPQATFAEKMMNYLEEEKRVKAVCVCFSDLEGRFQVLDYDKKFLLGSHDNLTFDGSSIRGFTALAESDLRLAVDWSSFRWLPADVFGAGKVMVFATVRDKDGSAYPSDFRGRLADMLEEMYTREGLIVNVAPEIEGFLFNGEHAEQVYDQTTGFELATESGYFNSLPQDTLRLFIDKCAEVQRAMAFENEKDHPEVAPAQFELNFKYSQALDTADQIQIYKLIARQVAKFMGLTACFLPKPVAGMNGSGMHTNMSLSKDGRNTFYAEGRRYDLSETAERFLHGILNEAKGLCLVMNSSVNAYRRLDPNYEAPNAIKYSATDRGSMVRIPIGNEKSARIEVRTVAPDCNPYLNFYALIAAGMNGVKASEAEYAAMQENLKGEVEILPGTIYEAIDLFEASEFMKETMGAEHFEKYLELKRMAAERCPMALGNKVKRGEVVYHHEITNQKLWKDF